MQNIVYAGGFKPGNIVVITAPDIVKGTFVGHVDNPLKFCGEDTVPVYIPTDPPRRICVDLTRGHTIQKATK